MYLLFVAWKKVCNMKPGFIPASVVSYLLGFSLFIFCVLSIAAENTKPASDPAFDELLGGFETTEKPESSNEPIDELMQGFDEPESLSSPTADSLNTTDTDNITANTGSIAEKKWRLTTLSSLSSSYSYQQQTPVSGAADHRGLSRLKLKLQPELRYKHNSNWDSVLSLSGFYDASYRLKDRSTYTTETLDSNETELEIRELYFRGTVNSSVDVKIGRQIVVWGKSDSLRVVDVLNPLDFREPGMVDIEDLRLPVTMLKADYYTGNWNISAIVIPEIRFNKMPAYGSDFYLGGDKKFPAETVPDDISNPEFALALIGNFSGWDLSMHFASYYDDQPHFVNTTPSRLEHSHLNMAGITANVVKSSWLFKSELAYIDGLEFASVNNSFSRADVMVGIDYNGIADMTFSVEAVNRHLFDYVSALDSEKDNTLENENQVSLRYTASFMHDKLQSTLLISFFGLSPDDGGFYRASLDYEIDNAMSIIIGGIVYQSGDSVLLKNIASNDRVFIDYRYTF